jgi:phage baseplate assembly protein W
MKSIAFPKMINKHSTQTVADSTATLQNIHLILGSEKGEFKFDPFFGIRLKRYMFEQNNYILRDILIDEIYEQLVMFIPQITLKRSDIKLTVERATVYLTIKCVNNADFTLNTYNLVLFEEQE